MGRRELRLRTGALLRLNAAVTLLPRPLGAAPDVLHTPWPLSEPGAAALQVASHFGVSQKPPFPKHETCLVPEPPP